MQTLPNTTTIDRVLAEIDRIVTAYEIPVQPGQTQDTIMYRAGVVHGLKVLRGKIAP